MKGLISRGRLANVAFVFLADTTSATGAGKTGLTNASAGLLIAVRRTLAAAMTAYSGANIGTIATLGTWVDPGAGKCNFREVDATNAPGCYEIHFQDSVFGTADASRVLLGMVQATGVVPTPFEMELIATNFQDGAAFGLSTLDAAISTRSTYAGGAVASVAADIGITQAAADKVWSTTARALTDKAGFAPTAAAIAAAVWDELTATARQVGGYGAALKAWLAALGTDNRVKVSADAHTSGETVAAVTDKTGYALATAPPTAAAIDTQLSNTHGSRSWETGTPPAALSGDDVAAAVLDALQAAHNTAGTIGHSIGAAGVSGDPLLNLVPDGYDPGTAGYALGTMVNRLGAATVQVMSPVAQDGTLTLIRGDDYSASDARLLRFIIRTADDLSGTVVVTLKLGALSIVGTLTAVDVGVWGAAFPLTALQTAALTPGERHYEYRIIVTRAERTLTEVIGSTTVR